MRRPRDTWQDDGLQVDYVLRNGQVDCVLRRLIEADGKLWQLQMTAPLAGSDLPEDRMTGAGPGPLPGRYESRFPDRRVQPPLF